MSVTNTTAGNVNHASGSGTSIVYTSYAVTGTNPVVLVKVAMNLAAFPTASVTSVVCSAGLTGTPSLISAGKNTGSDARVEIWAIPAPAGTGTITITISDSVAAWQSNVELYAGAHQTTPCPTGAGNVGTVMGDGTTNPLSVTLGNLTADDAASGMGANANAGDNPLHDQTRLFADNGSSVNASSGYHLGTGAVSCTWGSPTGLSFYNAVRIVAAAAGGGDLSALIGEPITGSSPLSQ